MTKAASKPAALRPAPFSKFFTLRTATPAQVVLYRCAFDGVDPVSLSDSERALARRMFGDVDVVPPEARRVVVIVKGRGIAGTRSGAERMLHLAVTSDLSSLGPDELAFCFLGGPKLRHGRVGLRFARSAAKHHGVRIVDDCADWFTIQRAHDGRRVRLEAFAASRGGDNTRGVPIVGALMTEAGFYFSEESGEQNGEAILSAMIPRLLRPSGQVCIESTPWGESGVLFNEFRRNHGDPQTALAALCPTTLMRPDAETLAMVAKERLRDEANARVEFDGEFAAGGGSFFDADLLRGSIDPELVETNMCPSGWLPFAGADVGLKNDNSAIVIVHRSVTDPVVIRIASVLELKPKKNQPLSLAVVVGEFCRVAKMHGVATVTSDHHLMSEVQLHAAPHGVRFVQAPGGAPAKAEQHIRARDCMRADTVRMPASFARLREQLGRIISTPQSGGSLKIWSPRSSSMGHGDAASACVLALDAAARGGAVPIDWEWVDSVQRAASPALEIPGPAFDGPSVHSSGGSWGGAGGWGML